MCNYFETKGIDDKTNVLFNLLAEISFPLLYFVSISYISVFFQSAKVSFLIFNSVIYLYFGFIIVKYAKFIPTIYENSLWIVALNVLIVIAFISHLATNLSANFDHVPGVLDAFVFVLQNSVKYVFFIIFFRSIRYIVDQNKHRFGFAGIILRGLYPTLYYLYMAVIVTFLWLIVIVKLNYPYFVGILSVLVVITVLALAKTYLLPLFNLNRKSNEIYIGSNSGLSQSLQTLIILACGWAFYNVSLKYFKLEVIVNYMSNRYLIITVLVEIPYFSLISDAFSFLVLFTLIGLLKNLFSFYETSKLTSRLRTP